MAEKKRKQEAAAAAEDVEVELSQQMGDLTSPSKPPAPKKHKDGGGDGGGDGGSASQDSTRLFSVDQCCIFK